MALLMKLNLVKILVATRLPMLCVLSKSLTTVRTTMTARAGKKLRTKATVTAKSTTVVRLTCRRVAYWAKLLKRDRLEAVVVEPSEAPEAKELLAVAVALALELFSWVAELLRDPGPIISSSLMLGMYLKQTQGMYDLRIQTIKNDGDWPTALKGYGRKPRQKQEVAESPQ